GGAGKWKIIAKALAARSQGFYNVFLGGKRFLFGAGFRLCGGDQRAFRSPFGNLRVPLLRGGCIWQGKGEPLLFCFPEGFASAEATKGLSDRPLETFGS